ncbi:MAG: 23S rRNA (guanosine(2251)-2'-O)-methyltransferase RlmB [Candidatus Dojkabacteria bacterium]|nr:23S rRNA (guanosine(2251)-2'-O)-methyltransferase RlmB [Candidatus Dojkabacteria bacterium]
MQIEGRNPVYELLNSENPVSIVFMQNDIGQTDKIKQIVSLAKKNGVRLRKIGRHKLDKLSRTKNHQGVIARVRRDFLSLNEILDKLDQEDKIPFFVMISEVLYQQNLGAIIRTAECAGCTGVIIPKKTRINEEAARASMGAVEHVEIIKENLFNAIKILKKKGVPVVGLEADGKRSIYETNLVGPITIIIGGEHSGIGKSLEAKCDLVLKIPLFGKINSLNMSNAAAIALFEKVRQEIV